MLAVILDSDTILIMKAAQMKVGVPVVSVLAMLEGHWNKGRISAVDGRKCEVTIDDPILGVRRIWHLQREVIKREAR